MISQSVTVVNQLGMHARAAAKFVHLATRYQSRVRVARESREMDGKSIMGILLLAAARGSTITISAEGQDEGDAVNALVALVQSGFGESPAGEAPAAAASEQSETSRSGGAPSARTVRDGVPEWGWGPTSGKK
jgi:phosphocarrier protein